MRRRSVGFWFWVLGFGLCSLVIGHWTLGIASSDDDLKAVVDKFFAAYAKKDLDGFMALWSAKSPEWLTRRNRMQYLFLSENCAFANLVVARTEVEDGKATLNVTVDLSATNVFTKQSRKQQMACNFSFVKEASIWKVWQYTTEADDLATTLIAAKSGSERQRLLTEKKDQVTPELVDALVTQGNRSYLQGDYPQALAIYRLAQGIAEQIGDKTGIARTLMGSGLVHHSQDNYSQALEFYQKAQKMFEELGDKVRIARTLNNIGDVYWSQDNYSQALEFYQKAQKMYEELGDKAGIARTLGNIGLVHHSQGNYPQALEFYQKAQKMFEELGDKAGIATALNNIGIVHDWQGNYPQALEFYQKAQKMYEELGDKAGIARTLNNIGEVHRSQGNYPQALEFYQKAQKMFEELGDKAGIAATLGNIGLVHASQDNYAQALEFHQRSLKMREEMGDKVGIATTLNGIGNVHHWQGNYVQALEFYQKARTMFEELGNKAGIAATLNNIGNVHGKQKNYVQALEFHQKSLAIAEAIGDPGATLRCYWGMGSVHEAQGRTQDALAAYQKAVDAFERIRVAGGEEERLTFLHEEKGVNLYDALVSLLVEQGKTDDALKYLERAKSKQLLDGLRLRSLTVRDDNLRALLHNTEQLEQAVAAQEKQRLAEISKPDDQQNPTRLANLSQLVASTRAELLQVSNRVRDANPDYERFITVKATDLRRIQKALPPDVVVVQYLPLDTALLIFVVTREGEQARSVAVTRQRIEELVSAFHTQMKIAQRQGGANVRDWDWHSDRARRLREALTALYGYLIAPIQKDIAKADTVVIIPSGMLYYLPFQALAHESSSSSSSSSSSNTGERHGVRSLHLEEWHGVRSLPSSLTFFVEEKRLAVLTSLDLWGQIMDEEVGNGRRAVPSRVGAFGNPDGTLPEAEKEAKRIGALFERSLVYVGAEATRQKLESLPADVQMAHLATHGALNERDINECYLTLANGDKLKLGEVYGLAGKYPARLTVLSACETAIDRKDPGNEVAHLAHGFVEAGSVTIVASLWQVSDASTAALMERFYKELKAGKSKAEAKRQAEMSLLKNKETAHPYFWSPFVLIGEWR